MPKRANVKLEKPNYSIYMDSGVFLQSNVKDIDFSMVYNIKKQFLQCSRHEDIYTSDMKSIATLSYRENATLYISHYARLSPLVTPIYQNKSIKKLFQMGSKLTLSIHAIERFREIEIDFSYIIVAYNYCANQAYPLLHVCNMGDIIVIMSSDGQRNITLVTAYDTRDNYKFSEKDFHAFYQSNR
jgi:hypothetical protein